MTDSDDEIVFSSITGVPYDPTDYTTPEGMRVTYIEVGVATGMSGSGMSDRIQPPDDWEAMTVEQRQAWVQEARDIHHDNHVETWSNVHFGPVTP